jgi:hypothetical protein
LRAASEHARIGPASEALSRGRIHSAAEDSAPTLVVRLPWRCGGARARPLLGEAPVYA